MNRTLEELIIELANKVNSEPINAKFRERLDDIFLRNGMINVVNTPLWLLDYFEALIQGKEVEHLEFGNESVSRAYNLINSLEGILEGEWNDYGGFITMNFDKIGVSGTIFWEGYSYSVGVDDATSSGQ